MLRITQSNSSAGAKAYFASALKTADYYQEGQEKAGIWHGKAASRLGLRGSEVDAGTFGKLAEGEGISQRKIANRKAGYDFTFNVPKSMSLVWSITQDERFIDAMETATKEAMAEVENAMEARVRVNNQNSNRTTGNLLYGAFTHTTTRPVHGTCDPHLHQHCFVMNATFDEVEQKWKAAETANLQVDRVYYEAVFHAKLADEVKKLGYNIEKTGRFWEIEGIDRETVEAFSRRTVEIEERAKELGVTYPDDKAKLGAMTRSRKSDDRPLDGLFKEWPQRLTDEQARKVEQVIANAGTGDNDFSHNRVDIAKHLLDFHFEKEFEQNSTLPEKRVFDSVLRAGVGRITNEDVKQAYSRRAVLIRGEKDGRIYVTTQEVAQEEQFMLGYARHGLGTKHPLCFEDHTIKRTFLNDQQKGAVKHVLSSNDSVMIISGGAGVGKTTLMQEAVEAMKEEIKEGAKGHKVFTFAPTHGAKDVLREDGFEEANTLQKLLLDEDMQTEVKDAVIWVDEAGLVSSPDMAKLFHIAEKQNSRIILSGDANQHSSIQRGDAMRLLQEQAGIKPAHVREIMRQTGDYKEAVNAAAYGDTDKAWAKFEEMGAVHQVQPEVLSKQVASDYLDTLKTGKTALVVAPTNKTKNEITSHIREGLKEEGNLEPEGHNLTTYRRVYLSAPELREAENLHDGQIAHFVKNAKGIKQGAHLLIGATDKDGQKVGFDDEGNRFIIPLNSEAFNLYEPEEKEFSVGEKIRITAGGKDKDGRQVNNGDKGVISGFTEDGDIILESGRKIPKDFGHIDYGYTSTGYSSQGTTVDVVLAALPEQDAPAINKESFYVTVSRGRGGNADNIKIVTDNLDTIKKETKTSSDRLGVCEINKFKETESSTGKRQYRYYADYLAAENGLGHSDPELNKQAQELVKTGGVNIRQDAQQEY